MFCKMQSCNSLATRRHYCPTTCLKYKPGQLTTRYNEFILQNFGKKGCKTLIKHSNYSYVQKVLANLQ